MAKKSMGLQDQEHTNQTAILFDFLDSMPLFVVGYVFGLLGGLLRCFSEKRKSSSIMSGKIVVDNISGGGVIGMMSSVLVQSDLLLFLIISDSSVIEKIDYSFTGISSVAFISAYFFAELSDRVRGIIVDEDRGAS
ncbi:MAG: hypothetical protein ACSHXI_20885 [Hoeflea sp.]|uniref:hypothetical protein n=1 Tax=Hoeflea sp. TaxID=1940281 RepID=UPI003EF3C0D2